MPSKTETGVAGLTTYLSGISGPTVLRNVPRPVDIPAAGLLIVRDGDPGEPEPTLGTNPTTWNYEHIADVEAYVQADDDTRDGLWDDLVAIAGTRLTADPTFGGAVDDSELGRPTDVDTLPVDGADAVKGGTIPVTMYYATQTPLQ